MPSPQPGGLGDAERGGGRGRRPGHTSNIGFERAEGPAPTRPKRSRQRPQNRPKQPPGGPWTQANEIPRILVRQRPQRGRLGWYGQIRSSSQPDGARGLRVDPEPKGVPLGAALGKKRAALPPRANNKTKGREAWPGQTAPMKGPSKGQTHPQPQPAKVEAQAQPPQKKEPPPPHQVAFVEEQQQVLVARVLADVALDEAAPGALGVAGVQHLFGWGG